MTSMSFDIQQKEPKQAVKFYAIKGDFETVAIYPVDDFSAEILNTELEIDRAETLSTIYSLLTSNKSTLIEYHSKILDIDEVDVWYTVDKDHCDCLGFQHSTDCSH